MTGLKRIDHVVEASYARISTANQALSFPNGSIGIEDAQLRGYTTTFPDRTEVRQLLGIRMDAVVGEASLVDFGICCSTFTEEPFSRSSTLDGEKIPYGMPALALATLALREGKALNSYTSPAPPYPGEWSNAFLPGLMTWTNPLITKWDPDQMLITPADPPYAITVSTTFDMASSTHTLQYTIPQSISDGANEAAAALNQRLGITGPVGVLATFTTFYELVTTTVAGGNLAAGKVPSLGPVTTSVGFAPVR